MSSVLGVAYKSKVGFMPGSNKVNQDSYVVCNFFNKKYDQYFFAVMDGHGLCGRDVS